MLTLELDSREDLILVWGSANTTTTSPAGGISGALASSAAPPSSNLILSHIPAFSGNSWAGRVSTWNDTAIAVLLRLTVIASVLAIVFCKRAIGKYLWRYLPRV